MEDWLKEFIGDREIIKTVDTEGGKVFEAGKLNMDKLMSLLLQEDYIIG